MGIGRAGAEAQQQSICNGPLESVSEPKTLNHHCRSYLVQWASRWNPFFGPCISLRRH